VLFINQIQLPTKQFFIGNLLKKTKF